MIFVVRWFVLFVCFFFSKLTWTGSETKRQSKNCIAIRCHVMVDLVTMFVYARQTDKIIWMQGNIFTTVHNLRWISFAFRHWRKRMHKKTKRDKFERAYFFFSSCCCCCCFRLSHLFNFYFSICWLARIVSLVFIRIGMFSHRFRSNYLLHMFFSVNDLQPSNNEKNICQPFILYHFTRVPQRKFHLF